MATGRVKGQKISREVGISSVTGIHGPAWAEVWLGAKCEQVALHVGTRWSGQPQGEVLVVYQVDVV